MKENKEIKEAKIVLRELSEEEGNQRIAELREKQVLDTIDIYDTGVEEGARREKIETAKKLIKIKMPVEKIKEITELEEEEIKKLINNKNIK